MMRLKYQNPPINELVVGVYFEDPVLELRAEHVGIFWRGIMDDLPGCQQQPPIGDDGFNIQNELFPLPRFWFISKDGDFLLQLQRNALLFNWRKREEQYPHFESVKSRFDRYLDAFSVFCQDVLDIKMPPPKVCELTYINLIDDESYWSGISDVSKIIPSYTPLAIHHNDEKPADFNVTYLSAIANDLSLQVRLQSRKHIQTKKDVLYLELRATGSLDEGTRMKSDQWFARAHDAIGDAFNTMTNPDIQRQHWRPIEASMTDLAVIDVDWRPSRSRVGTSATDRENVPTSRSTAVSATQIVQPTTTGHWSRSPVRSLFGRVDRKDVWEVERYVIRSLSDQTYTPYADPSAELLRRHQASNAKRQQALVATQERLAALKSEARESDIIISAESETELLDFLNKCSATRRPYISLLDNGNLRAVWRNLSGEQIAIQFRGKGRAQFVLFAKQTSSDFYSKTAGQDVVSNLMNQIEALNLRPLMVA